MTPAQKAWETRRRRSAEPTADPGDLSLPMTTLRPGLLVSLKTHIQGNVRYEKRTIEQSHIVDGVERAKWETERTVMDPEELELAKVARGKCSTLIRSVCAVSAFGLLCPETSERQLAEAIAEARKVADEFNSTARLSRISVYVITGRIAQDDVEAVRAINSEVRDLMEDMQRGVKNLDAKTIRDAAAKARNLGSMLSPQAEARVKIAIDTARKVAREIVKAGETAAAEVDLTAISKLATIRTAFLDLDEMEEISVPKAEGRAVDFATSTLDPVSPDVRKIEME